MITTSIRRHDLVGNATAGPFSYQFLIKDKSYLQVWVDGALKTLDTHYTVSGVGNESGGSITFTTGNEPALNAEIIILGNEPYTQTSDYQDAGSFPAASHEEALDKLTRLATQILELTSRVPVLGIANHYNKSALTLGALVAGQFLRATPTEDGVECAVPTTVPSGLSVGGNYDHLTVNGSGVIEWAQQVYNFSSGWVNISRYGNSLSSAVSTIGSVTKVTLVISSLISVPGNVTVTSNITFSFKGAGGLSIANGVTVSYAAGGYEVDDIRRQRFSGLGTFNGSNLSEVIPDHWGADYTGTSDSTDAIQAAISSLPATKGGKLKFLSGIYDFDTTIDVDRPLTIEGQGIDSTVLNMTDGATSLNHGILSEDPSLTCRHFTIQVGTPLTTNQQMYAIRMNLDGSGITGGRFFHVEHVKATGWNAGFYCDGGSGYAIENAFYDHFYIQSSGPAADYIGSACYQNRVRNGYIGRGIIDQNDTGEHAIYCFGPRTMTVEKLIITNASRGESQAVKIVGDGTVGTEVYGTWTVRDVDFDDCFHGVLIGLFGTEQLGTVEVANLKGRDITGSTNIPGGLVTFSVAGTSTIEQVRITNIDGKNMGYQAVHFAGANGAMIKLAVIDGMTLYNWSTASTGTDVAVGASGANILKLLVLKNVYADGNSNGRCIWSVNGFGGYGTERLTQFRWENLYAVSCTAAAESIPTINAADATPTLRFGTTYNLTNGSAQNITAFDDLIQGERYLFYATDGNSTLVDGANLVCPGSANLNPGATDLYTGFSPNGTVMVIAGGSNN